MPQSKYTRQIASARKLITKKGTLCTWYKSADTDLTDDTAPEFPSNDMPTPYASTPIAFYPEKRSTLATLLGIPLTGSNTDQLFGVIPGDVPFTPEIDDAVMIGYVDGTLQTVHVAWVNTTQPDLAPIVYEIGFK